VPNYYVFLVLRFCTGALQQVAYRPGILHVTCHLCETGVQKGTFRRLSGYGD